MTEDFRDSGGFPSLPGGGGRHPLGYPARGISATVRRRSLPAHVEEEFREQGMDG
ncbi:MAG: hypothetical protein OXF25_01010 [Cyanobacteria bacterium MAG CAR3_bin_5]|nr:hypothetical protein [Cyanobacteria bacterium MAG CAR3_bin_5]